MLSLPKLTPARYLDSHVRFRTRIRSRPTPLGAPFGTPRQEKPVHLHLHPLYRFQRRGDREPEHLDTDHPEGFRGDCRKFAFDERRVSSEYGREIGEEG